MELVRQNKIRRLIQKELIDIFLREARNLFGGGMITVTHVRVSPDLSVAKVYLSLLGVQDKKKFFETTEDRTFDIKKKLYDRILNKFEPLLS